jgi:cell division protein FtsX
MKDKLGVYIYLNDIASEEKEAVNIKTALEEKGLKVSYTSKADALGFVEKRIPELTDTFKKYNLQNPLPSTLYINYADKDDFAAMKEILEANKDKILNMSDVSDNAIKTQEKRVLNVINLSNFLQSFAYFVVFALLLTIITFAIFFLRTIFSHFS